MGDEDRESRERRAISIWSIVSFIVFGVWPPKFEQPDQQRWSYFMSGVGGTAMLSLAILGLSFFGEIPFVPERFGLARAADLETEKSNLDAQKKILGDLNSDILVTLTDRSALKICRIIRAAGVQGADQDTLQGSLDTERANFRRLVVRLQMAGGSYLEQPCDLILLAGAN